MKEGYTFLPSDLEAQAATIQTHGSMQVPDSTFIARYTIPGVHYLTQPVYISFIVDSYRGKRTPTIVLVSEARGGNQSDPTPLINRPTTIKETEYMATLLGIRFPSDASDIGELAAQHIQELMQTAQAEEMKSRYAVPAAEAALLHAREVAEEAGRTASDTSNRGAEAIARLRSW